MQEKNSAIYNVAKMDRRLFSKIMSDENYLINVRLIRQPGYSVVLIEGLMRDKMEEDICIIDSDLCIIQIYSAGVSIHLI